LAHQYFGIDLEAVWAVVESDLPELKQKVRNIAGEKPGGPVGPDGIS
jgi:uncharacterized protein with HEPN domain